jgi:hypothetical protein
LSFTIGLKVGCVVSVRFLDHMIGPKAGLLECEVFGRLVKIKPKEVLVEHWSVLTRDAALKEFNSERVAIVRSAILSIVEFRPLKPGKSVETSPGISPKTA